MRRRLFVAPVLSIGLLGSAILVAPGPDEPHVDEPALRAPPTAAVLMAVSLGRHAAAADVAWLRARHFIGAPHSERVQYAGLEDWVHLITDLDPTFDTPYFHGSILLATLPGRHRAAAEILDSAEQNLVPDSCRAAVDACPLPDFTSPDDVRSKCVPCRALVEQECNWEVPLSRGFVAYFGALDAQSAARVFCESRRRGGPSYLTAFAARLANKTTNCRELREDLGGLARQAGQGGSQMLRGGQEQLRVLVNCEQEALKHASQVFRLRNDNRRPESIAELLEAGILDEPPWVPEAGACWLPYATGKLGFELGRCPPKAAP